MAVFSIAALRTEINGDPKALGYATLRTLSNGPEALAVKLNELGASAETLFKMYTPLEDIVAGIVRSEYDGLSAAGKDYLTVVMRAPRIKTGDSLLRGQIGAIFGAGMTTRTNLTNIASRACSRAEALWGEGFAVSDAWCSEAITT
jgi:hypothetical protein